MLNRKEKQRIQWALLVLFGFHTTFEQWCRVILPFSQWQLQPSPSLFDLLILNSIGSIATLIGSIFIAQVIDTNGCFVTSILVTVVTSFYEMTIGHITNYYLYGFMQLLLIANHFPMTADALISQLVGEDGDDKERASLIMRLTIPQSIAFAAGPYLAIQTILLLAPGIPISLTMCGCLHILTVLPMILLYIPQTQCEGKRSYLPSFNDYTEMLSNVEMRWSLLFLMMIVVPYSAYDQIIRTNLTFLLISDPTIMAKLAFLIGLTTFVANIFVLPALQSRFGPQALLQMSFATVTVSYLYLSQLGRTVRYAYLFTGMPIQILGVTMALGQLSAQIMGQAGRSKMGKAAALNRGVQLAAMAVSPLICGQSVDGTEAKMLCYASAVISILGIVAVRQFGTFMHSHFQSLPLRTHTE